MNGLQNRSLFGGVSYTSECDHLVRIKRSMRTLGIPVEDVQYLANSFLSTRTRSGKDSPFEKLACRQGTTFNCFCVHCIYATYATSIDANKAHFRETEHTLGCCRQCEKAVGLYCFQCAKVIKTIPKISSKQSRAPLKLRDSDTSMKGINITSRRVLPKIKLYNGNRRSDACTTINCRGLVNFGKTCYMNSIIQVLVHTPTISDHFIHNHNVSEEMQTYNDRTSVITVFHKLLSEFRKKNSQPIYPKDIFSLVKRIMPEMGGNKQNDAHEFFTLVINLLHTELISLKGADTTKESLIDRTFLGCLESKVSCGVCGQTRSMNDPFRDISLQVISQDPFDEVSVDLSELLCKFTQVEHLDDPSDFLQCPNCERHTQSTKQLMFKVLPSVVCIQLKRFAIIQRYLSGFSFTKLKAKVNFPDYIDFSSFECEPRNDENIYSLYAVVSHTGTYSSGHYRTYLRKSSNWICLDDATVKHVSRPETFGSEAYLLFYMKEN